MPLFEHMPYTNFQNVNFDWIMKTLKEHTDDLTSLREDVTTIQNTISVIEGDITNIKTDITNIYEQIGEIDIEALEERVDVLETSDATQNADIASIKARLTTAEGNIQTNADDIEDNDQASRGRDDALSARIRNLEQATIHDIYNYYGSKNMIIFGSDLRALPDNCKDADGFPFCWGNKYNQRFSVGVETPRAWKMTDYGLTPDTQQTAYDYYQCGTMPTDCVPSPTNPITMTLKINGGTSASYIFKHTFTGAIDWEIAQGCLISPASYDANLGGRTVWLKGTPQSWNTFLNQQASNGAIEFMFFEYGEGSIDSAKPIPFDIKDRNFFGHDATPTIEVETIEGNASATATVTYYDQVGEPQTLEAGVNLLVSASKYGKVVDGYLQMTINLQNNLGDKLASGAQFTLENIAMSYLSDAALPMPRGSSTLLGVATDSRSLAWDYVNTQNAYIWFDIDNGSVVSGNRGTFNVKLISSGMRNYTSGSATGTTMLKIPFHYIAS